MSFLSEQSNNRTKLLALCLAWTVCLSLTTLNIQHSCDPIVGASSTECGKIVASRIGDSQLSGGGLQLEATKEAKLASDKGSISPAKPANRNPSSGGAQASDRLQSSNDLIPAVVGTSGGAIAGVAASALVGAEMVAATLPLLGGAVIATPVAVTVATGMMLFLVVRSLMDET